jgi:hypothetical protein
MGAKKNWLNGALLGVLSADDALAIRAYVIERAAKLR